MKTYVKFAMASALALATAGPAFAQTYRPTDDYQRRAQEYQYQRESYEHSRQNYDQSQDNYREARKDYRQARREYDRRLNDWEVARGRYDARYGYGSYARRYARPMWDEAYWARSADPAYAGQYGYNASSSGVRCDSNNGSTVAAGAIGAILGGIFGSNVAGRGDRTEGAVLGALAGGGLGAAVGTANAKYKCDSRGAYFARNETMPYRESRRWRYGANDSSYYSRQRCRLATAPVDSYGRDYRYIRVCPDDMGRYRISG